MAGSELYRDTLLASGTCRYMFYKLPLWYLALFLALVCTPHPESETCPLIISLNTLHAAVKCDAVEL